MVRIASRTVWSLRRRLNSSCCVWWQSMAACLASIRGNIEHEMREIVLIPQPILDGRDQRRPL
jgi:hypothetical protein